MPRYFFDIDDGCNARDDVGTVCADPEAAALEARRILPAIAVSEIPKQGDRKNIAVLVTDEENRAVYSATLSFVGTWLIR